VPVVLFCVSCVCLTAGFASWLLCFMSAYMAWFAIGGVYGMKCIEMKFHKSKNQIIIGRI
jgi:hypothetical protein